MEAHARTLSGINVLAGIWLIIAPFILNYTSTGNKWQEVVFGIIIGILGIIRLGAPHLSWPSWINLLIGIWIIIAPWTISNTTTSARWNEVIVGIIVALLAWSSGAITITDNRHGTKHPQAHA
jgi:cytochrome c biogenesis protein CcdA